MRQVGVFHGSIPVPPPIYLTTTIYLLYSNSYSRCVFFSNQVNITPSPFISTSYILYNSRYKGSLNRLLSGSSWLNRSRNSGYRIGCVMVSMLASCLVDRGFELQSGQTKDYKICICCFSAPKTHL